jgi:aspartyl-tRNA(Asn)/glutamyl-tRNA(Gln) amidotransferase subunit A
VGAAHHRNAIVEKTDQGWEDPTGEEFELALEVQDRNWHRLRSALAKYDLLLSPTVQFTAPSFNEWDAIFARNPKFSNHLSANTLMFNRLGFPAATVPAGFVEAMPVGVQIVGRPNGEARILQLAHAFLKLSA